MRRYVIVGSGAAGVSAAEGIRTLDRSGEIWMVTQEQAGYYSRPGLAYYLTGELPEEMLFPFRGEEFQRLGVRLVQAQATGLDPQNHILETVEGGGQRLQYDRLLLACGAQAIQMQVPGSTLAGGGPTALAARWIQRPPLPGVVKLDDLNDARHILKLARKARTAVVVGGGITALELVEGLLARKVKVHYFLRGDRYWSNVLDEAESRIVEERLRLHGVSLHFHTELAEIVAKKGRFQRGLFGSGPLQVGGVHTQDGRSLACDLVAYAIGVRPRLKLAQAGGLKIDRGVLVDETLRTSQEDIFAAGDVAQVFDPLSGQAVLDSLWGPARQQGYAAGVNMAGGQQAYRKLIPFNVTRLAGLTVTIIGAVGGERQADDPDLQGIARGDSETWRRCSVGRYAELPDTIAAQTGFDVNRLRLLVGRDRLLGALVMGDQTLSRPLQILITHGADISLLRSALLAPGAPLEDLLVDFWSSWRQHAPISSP